jgi:hypothetical protein
MPVDSIDSEAVFLGGHVTGNKEKRKEKRKDTSCLCC